MNLYLKALRIVLGMSSFLCEHFSLLLLLLLLPLLWFLLVVVLLVMTKDSTWIEQKLRVLHA